MRAIVITQDEPIYIASLLTKLVHAYKTTAAIIFLPGTPYGMSNISHIKRLYEMFGLRDFIIFGFLFVYHIFLIWAKQCSFFKYFHLRNNIEGGIPKSIPTYKIKKLNSPETLSLLRMLQPEIIISVAAPQVFREELISIPKYAINIHAALLPSYRGQMPSFWVLAKGEEKTGVTVHYIDKNIDTGNIILQRAIKISPKDTLHSLQKKVAHEGADALIEVLNRIENNSSRGFPHEGPSSYYSFPTKEAAKEFRKRGRKFI